MLPTHPLITPSLLPFKIPPPTHSSPLTPYPSLQALVLVMRVAPSVVGHVLPFIPKFWSRVLEDYEARAAVLWMLGEYGQDVPEAPYLLEAAASDYNQVI